MSIVWLNGALIDAADARIDPADRGFTLGDGLFESMRLAAGEPCHAARHFARLREGAAVLGIAVPAADEALHDAICAVARENRLTEAAARLTLSRGPALRGLLPVGVGRSTILITAAPLPPPLPPARLVLAQRTRRNELSPLSRIKSLNYLDSVLARQEATDRGADDALLLNTHDHLAEATAANVVLKIGGIWLTPRVEDGALPGIARGLLVDRGAIVPRLIDREDLRRTEAGWLVNSLGQRGIVQIDDVRLAGDLGLPGQE